MLIRFGCSNHLSIREYQEISLVASKQNPDVEVLQEVPLSKLKVLPVAGVYGANASGKSNLIDSLAFIKFMVSESQPNFKPDIPIENIEFGLDSLAQTEESHFECEFVVQGTRFVYGFTILRHWISKEFLYAYPKGHKQLWFSRDEHSGNNKYEFGSYLKGRNTIVADTTRANSLFLSAAAQQNHEQLKPVYSFFAKELIVGRLSSGGAGPTDRVLRMLEGSNRQWVIEFLRSADFGVTDAKIEEDRLPEDMKQFMSSIFTTINDSIDRDILGGGSSKKSKLEVPQEVKLLKLGHSGKDGTTSFFHWEHESAGTRGLLLLLSNVLLAIERGGVAIIDEIDTSLHTLLASRVVQLFRDRYFNKGGAQLVFSTHDTNLLCHGHLRHDEVWFTEKDPYGQTHVYPLSDFKLRKSDKIEKGYLSGRFGAIPFVGSIGDLPTNG